MAHGVNRLGQAVGRSAVPPAACGTASLGHAVLFVSGYVASLVFGGWRPENVERLTFHSHNAKAAILT